MSAPPSVRSLRLRCPAKINLHLRVAPPRGDGFHPLLSWMCTVGLFDTLTLERSPGAAAGGGEDAGAAGTFELTSDSPGLPCDGRNLVVRVASAWAAQAVGGGAAAGPLTPLRARLEKRIPVGAGLGGGSSDAARVILGLARLWPGGVLRVAGGGGRRSPGGRFSVDAWRDFAARFGSDVPFFLFGPSAACAGRGEVVRPVPRPRPGWALLVLPPVMMPTADVYRRFDELRLGHEADVTAEPDWRHWATLSAHDLLPRLVNDLEPAAFAIRPDLGELRHAVEQSLARPVRMSGSGSSLFTLFDQESEATRASEAVAAIQRPMRSRVEVVALSPRVDDDLASDAS